MSNVAYSDSNGAEVQNRLNTSYLNTRSSGYFQGSDNSRSVLIPDIRTHIEREYFNKEGVLENEKEGEFPPNRERARDVIRYKWKDDELELEEHVGITIGRRKYSPAKEREYKRTELLDDPKMKAYIEAVLRLVPPEKRHQEGTVGINFFRTRSDVVKGPHKDEVEYVFTHVIAKNGRGARTELYEENGSDPSTSVILQPGDFIFHNDEEKLHNVTPLEPAVDGSASWRDVIVCTIDRSPFPYVNGDLSPYPGVDISKVNLDKIITQNVSSRNIPESVLFAFAKVASSMAIVLKGSEESIDIPGEPNLIESIKTKLQSGVEALKKVDAKTAADRLTALEKYVESVDWEMQMPSNENDNGADRTIQRKAETLAKTIVSVITNQIVQTNSEVGTLMERDKSPSR